MSAAAIIAAVCGILAAAGSIARWYAGCHRAGLATEPLLKGTLGGTIAWVPSAPTLVIR